MHFFIDTTNLQPQAATNTFGVVSPTIYNVASKFNLGSATKAFAPVKGQIIVQQSTDAALVNVILKPMEAVKTNIAPVKYFVFRGITKSSFIQGTDDIVPTGSELIQRFWTDYNNWLSKLTTPPPTPKVDVFGYDQNTIANTESIRSVFMNGHDVRPFVVQEGMWIGDFAANKTVGMEIILADGNFIPTLEYARLEEYKIEIKSTLSVFEKHKNREEILNFIDPAAFYGLYYKTGVKINGTNTKVKKEQLYTDILEKFHTKNTIYLDIRNEEGYSYNFFENYPNGSGDNIEVNINGNGFVPQVYENNHWPILAINPTGTTNNTETDIEIKLRTDDNPEPLIYHTDIVTTPDKKYGQFIGTDAIMNVSSVWSKALFFKAFNRQNGNAFQNVATYCRINYFRKVAYVGNNPKVPERTNLYKNLFGPINHSEINNNNGIRRLNLGTHNLDSGTLKENDYIQVVDRYVTWDDDIIVFQTGTTDSYQKSKAYVNMQKVGYKNKIAIQIQANSTNKDYLLNFYFDKFTIDDNGNEIPVLELTSNEGTRLEEHAILGLSKTEFNTITDTQTLSTLGFDVNSDIFISLKFDTALPFGDNKTCDRFKIELTGNDLNGNYKTELLTQTVYTLDWVTFTTKDFIETSIKQEVFDYRGIFYVDDEGSVVKLDANFRGDIKFEKGNMAAQFKAGFQKIISTDIGKAVWDEQLNSREHTILFKIVNFKQKPDYDPININSLGRGGRTVFNIKTKINGQYDTGIIKTVGEYEFCNDTNIAKFLDENNKLIENLHFIGYDYSHINKLSANLVAEIVYHEITNHVNIDPKSIFDGEKFDLKIPANIEHPEFIPTGYYLPNITFIGEPDHVIFGLQKREISTIEGESYEFIKVGGFSVTLDTSKGLENATKFIDLIITHYLNHLFFRRKKLTQEEAKQYMLTLRKLAIERGIHAFVNKL